MVNVTRIGGYTVREDSEEIHVVMPSGRVAEIDGDDYHAFRNQVYAAMRSGATVAVDVLSNFLKDRGIRNL